MSRKLDIESQGVLLDRFGVAGLLSQGAEFVLSDGIGATCMGGVMAAINTRDERGTTDEVSEALDSFGVDIQRISDRDERETTWTNSRETAAATGWNYQHFLRTTDHDAVKHMFGARRSGVRNIMYPAEALPWLEKLRSKSGRNVRSVKTLEQYAVKMARQGRTLLDYDIKTIGDGIEITDSSDVVAYLLGRDPEEVDVPVSGWAETNEVARVIREEFAELTRNLNILIRKEVRDAYAEIGIGRGEVDPSVRIISNVEAAAILRVPVPMVSRHVSPLPGRRGVYRYVDVMNAVQPGVMDTIEAEYKAEVKSS